MAKEVGVIALGSAKTGKSTFLRSFKPKSGTIGATNTGTYAHSEHEKTKLKLIDTPSAEGRDDQYDMFIRQAHIAVVFFDLQNKASLERAKALVGRCKRAKDSIAITLYGNTKGKKAKGELLEQARAFAKQQQITFKFGELQQSELHNSIISQASRLNDERPSPRATTTPANTRLKIAKQRYQQFWHKPSSTCFTFFATHQPPTSQPHYKACIRNILADYVKYSCCGSWFSRLSRLFSGHWNRHHITDVTKLIQDIDTGSLDLNGMLKRLNTIQSKPHFNKTGSLAMRISFIKQQLSGITSINSVNTVDNNANHEPATFSFY